MVITVYQIIAVFRWSLEKKRLKFIINKSENFIFKAVSGGFIEIGFLTKGTRVAWKTITIKAAISNEVPICSVVKDKPSVKKKKEKKNVEK